jgi:hypothetical protein
MLFYTEWNTPRFRYAASALLQNFQGELIFTSDENQFQQNAGPKIWYGAKNQSEAKNIFQGTSLIWQNGINPLPIFHGSFYDHWTFGFSSETSNDIFSATFYLLSRYEEYLSFEGDKHGRFKASDSVLFEQQRFRIPVINQWRLSLQSQLKVLFPEIVFKSNPFEVKASIDVDSAFAYRHKGWYRTTGGFAKDVVSFRMKNFAERLATLIHLKEDVYETYDYIISTCQKHQVPVIWFFLLSNFSKEDVNVPHTSSALRKLIQRLAEKHEVGIHPGYASNNDDALLTIEIGRLQDILKRKVNQSRQHYLKMKMPQTYRQLILLGITDDYTMGYAEEVGYRAGTSMPFKWYDLESNELTSLTIHPFSIMDTTLNKYLGLNTHQAKALLQKQMEISKQNEGNFMMLWHNESLSEVGIWKGWREVWESALTSEC